MIEELSTRISIRMGDITQIAADAIVNAANPTLLGGEGVDGAIHWAAGAGLLEECQAIGRCPTGDARITGGYNLPCRYLIHTVGPVYRIDGNSAPSLLASCYLSCLELATLHHLETITFPAISCGSYGYPALEACRIAIDSVWSFLEQDATIKKVTFVLYRMDHYENYRSYLREKCGKSEAG